MQLYKLTEEMTNLQKIMEEDGVRPEEIDSALVQVQGEIKAKATDIGALYFNIQAEIDTLKAEEQRLARMRKRREGQQDYLKNYLLENLQAAGITDPIKTPMYKIAIRKNNPSVIVPDPDQVPSEFIRIVPEQHEPMKKEILDFWKAHKDEDGYVQPDWFEVITDKVRLEIK